MDTQLRKSTDAVRTALAEVAYCIYRICEKADWGSLGFASEQEYCAGLGYTESSWGSYLLLGERLSYLTLDMMRQIPTNSARLLTTISGKIWGEFAWAEEARMLPAKDFALLVRERVKSQTQRGLAEPKSSLSLQVPLTQRDEFERRLDSLRRRERLTSPAEVLDFALRSAEKDPARAGALEKLTQTSAELDRLLDLPLTEDIETQILTREQARKLTFQIQKSLRELRRYATTPSGASSSAVAQRLQVEVAGNNPSHGTDLAQA